MAKSCRPTEKFELTEVAPSRAAREHRGKALKKTLRDPTLLRLANRSVPCVKKRAVDAAGLVLPSLRGAKRRSNPVTALPSGLLRGAWYRGAFSQPVGVEPLAQQ